MERPLRIIIVSRVVILLFFLLIIGFSNIPRLFITERGHYLSYFQTLSFINGSLVILFFIGVFSIISGVCWYLKFPYKNIAPFISGILTLFSVELLYRFFLFLERVFIKSGFDIALRKYYIIIFIFSLFLGYLSILNRYRKLRLKELYEETLDQKSYSRGNYVVEKYGKKESRFFETSEETPEKEPANSFQEAIYRMVEKIVAGMISFVDALFSFSRK